LPRVLTVDDGDLSATRDQRDRGGQPGRAGPDDQHVRRGGKHEKASYCFDLADLDDVPIGIPHSAADLDAVALRRSAATPATHDLP
jgi:hypothetical protein